LIRRFECALRCFHCLGVRIDGIDAPLSFPGAPRTLSFAPAFCLGIANIDAANPAPSAVEALTTIQSDVDAMAKETGLELTANERQTMATDVDEMVQLVADGT
jgi:hypothetical protein